MRTRDTKEDAARHETTTLNLKAPLAGWTEEAMARVIRALADADFAVKGGEKDSAYKSHSS
jgi:DNA polymerase III delta subunit